jgi:2-phosphosulfolactate phosphatase
MRVAIVIDVFRAFTTASYVLDRQPTTYRLAFKQDVIEKLVSQSSCPLVIGKPEKGRDGAIFTIPNSPTRVCEVGATQKEVLHRTEAGARGVLAAKSADLILAAAFVNAAATASYVKSLRGADIAFFPMGHVGTVPS